MIVQFSLVPSLPAFQTFEEFSRSRNKLYNAEVWAMAEPVRAHPGGSFLLYLSVRLSPGWHIYSLDEKGGEESLATEIRFEENDFRANGPWVEPEPVITLDGALNKVVKVHENAVQFSQEQSVPGNLKPGNYFISGKIVFRACDNKICALPKETRFQTEIQITQAGEPR